MSDDNKLVFESDDYYAGEKSIEFNFSGACGAIDVTMDANASGVSACITYYLMIDDVRKLIPKLQEVVERHEALFEKKT